VQLIRNALRTVQMCEGLLLLYSMKNWSWRAGQHLILMQLYVDMYHLHHSMPAS
jgi:hypothetical protein